MHDKSIVLVFGRGAVDAGQMIAVEDNGDWLINCIELVQKVRSLLISEADALGVIIDRLFLFVGELGNIGFFELVVRVEIIVGRMILHGNQLDELGVIIAVD